MLWIQSYLSEVGRHLPAAQRDDILAELGSSLADQARDLADGQPPTPEQEQQVIDRMGHPLKVASGYGRQRYLIGPELFPTYLEVLRIVLVIVGLIQCAVMLTAYVSTGWNVSITGLIKGVLETLTWAGLIVTAVFATTEYFGENLNFYDSWRATSLKPSTGGSVISRSDLVTNLVTEGVFLLWWNSALKVQDWVPGLNGPLAISLNEVWAPLFWPLNLLCGAWFLLHAVVLIRGLWGPTTLWLEIALGTAGLIIAGWLLIQWPLVDATGVLAPDTSLTLNRVVFTTIVVIAGFILWDIYLAAKRLRGKSAAGLNATALS